MDLLLYLVQNNEVDLKNISIARIADGFQEYLDQMTQADLGISGDFLFMASRLMALKVKELLPREEQEEMDEFEFDESSEAFLLQMLEYQKFKEISVDMRSMEEETRECFYRGTSEKFEKEKKEAAESDVGIYELFQAFQKSVRTRGPADSVHTIELDYYTIEDAQQAISNYLLRHGRATYEDLIGPDAQPIVMSVTFMALLEMVKTDDIVIRQTSTNSVIWVYRKKDNVDFTEEMAQDELQYTPDPDIKPGLSALLRQRGRPDSDLVSLDSVLRDMVNKVNDGGMVHDAELTALLEGKVLKPISFEEVKEERLSQLLEKKEALENLEIPVFDPLPRTRWLPTPRRVLKCHSRVEIPRSKKSFLHNRHNGTHPGNRHH